LHTHEDDQGSHRNGRSRGAFVADIPVEIGFDLKRPGIAPRLRE
jgi:hypothetical protein